jgi:hypothetical protein
MTSGYEPRTHPGTSTYNSEVILSLCAWWDPELAVVGHDPRGDYTESHWLPVLGPSALLALRWAARTLRAHPQGVEMKHREFARAIGLGARTGPDTPSVRCLERLCYFGLARLDLDSSTARVLAVRTHVPALPSHLHQRLPRNLRQPPEQQVTE